MTSKHEHIAGSLISDILAGQYRVNERLPSERDLAARFDANRGAVREAMKKLEQLGLAEVKPGGARVQDRNQASLDVIGHMLDQGDLPEAHLVDQILVVIHGLMGVAAEQSLERAGDKKLEEIRGLAQRLFNEDLDAESHTLARFELMQAIMLSSDNLPLQIIARSLFEQVGPRLQGVSDLAQADRAAHAVFARQLDQAIAKHDLPALRASFAGLSELNRTTMMRALEVARGLPSEAQAPERASQNTLGLEATGG